MNDANTERLDAIIPDRRDAKAVHELLTEIEEILGCGASCAVALYDRLKVARRAVEVLRPRNEHGQRIVTSVADASITAILARHDDQIF